MLNPAAVLHMYVPDIYNSSRTVYTFVRVVQCSCTGHQLTRQTVMKSFTVPTSVYPTSRELTTDVTFSLACKINTGSKSYRLHVHIMFF